MPKPLRHTTIVLAALLCAAAAAVAAPATAAPAAVEQATNTCWLDVINDWLDNNQVDRTYAIPCYTQAIQHLNALPDVTGYSSAIDDIHRALLARYHQDGGGLGGGGGNDSSGGPTAAGGGTGGGGNGGTGGGTSSGHGGGGVLGLTGGGSDATSVPLPLIVLGGLAVLLALAALATWIARRYQGRRPTPAPATARRR